MWPMTAWTPTAMSLRAGVGESDRDVSAVAMAEKKVIGRPFQRGQSGNPSGRSKDTHTISQLAKAYTEEAIEKLAEIMRTGKTEQAQVRAAEALLDRGWGKAPQHVGGSEGGEPIRVYLKNFIYPKDDDPMSVPVESDEPAVRIR